MLFLFAQRSLATLGGAETFVLTLAENVAALGHEVLVWTLELGLAAELAGERAVEIISEARLLPTSVDATIALDRAMAIELALRFPRATRLYAMHNANEVWLPPPEPGVVAATLAANDRMLRLARGCRGAGEVVRIQQPIDLNRFSPQGRWPHAKPARILLIGNYFRAPGQRIEQLKAAWDRRGLEWRIVGHPSEPTLHAAAEMARSDIVVGYGRSILEAMACGRPAYVHEHSGSDGWVTRAAYDQMEADGFSGAALRTAPTVNELRQDFALYDAALGRVGHDLVRRHDARLVAADVVAVVCRLAETASSFDPTALHGLRNLAESHLRAEREIASLRRRLRLKSWRSRAKRSLVRVFAQVKSVFLHTRAREQDRSRPANIVTHSSPKPSIFNR